METPDRDRSDGLLSPWPAPGAGLPAAPVAWGEPTGEAKAAAFDARIIWRAFRRHWWQILLCWVVASAGALALIYKVVPPTYRATAWLQIEPTPRSLLTANNTGQDREFGPFMQTQVLLITSPDVLSAALQEKGVKGLPWVRQSLDAEADLRASLEVEAQTGTHLILVSMSNEAPALAPTLVNAVVNAYMKVAQTWTTTEGQAQIGKLRDTHKKFEGDVAEKQKTLLNLLKDKGGDSTMVRDKDQIVLDEFRQFSARLAGVKIERIKAESARAILEEEARSQGRLRTTSTPSRPRPEELQEQVEQAFFHLPEVAAVVRDIQATQGRYDEARHRARKANEPTVKRFGEQLEDLKAQYADLWASRKHDLERSVLSGAAAREDPVLVQQAEDLRRARLETDKLKAEEERLATAVNKVKIETKEAGDQAVNIEFAKADLEFARKLLEGVASALHQAEYEAQAGTRISLISLAKPSSMPEKDTRLKLMLATPVLLLGMFWGLFLLLEIRAGRVANPDDLPARVRVGVIGVVPPLPASRAGNRGRALRDDRRRVEEFVQSLDHLRVALCAPTPGAAGRRCLLITSAVGGEGKTTLAAQLAGRCANAGLLTLLVDADLRRPSLGDLLEVPEGPGLADILAGEATPEAAMVVIGNAGGFHLLPAGTLVADPSRLLQGERLGTLLAQFRATFDVVIVDAPPVLAVPDALLLGRWTDGAVLTVRHDTSRFPLVERANRRLASVGIAVLGAVVNGVRTMETNYGAYHYDPYAGRGAGAAGPGPG